MMFHFSIIGQPMIAIIFDDDVIISSTFSAADAFSMLPKYFDADYFSTIISSPLYAAAIFAGADYAEMMPIIDAAADAADDFLWCRRCITDEAKTFLRLRRDVSRWGRRCDFRRQLM